MLLELLDAFLHRDRVDDALALDALEARLDHFPLGGVDHDRHAGDVRLAGNQIEEGHHGLLRIQHAFVHVDVDHLGAGLDLLQRDFQRLGVVVLADQASEFGRTGDVGALTDVDEQRVAVDGEGLQARQATGLGNLRDHAGRVFADGLGDRLDMRGGGAAAAADDVEKARGGELFYHRSHLRRAFVVFAEGVRQAGVGVRGNLGAGLAGQLFQVRPQFLGAERAVQPHGDGVGMAHRVPEGFGGLAGQGAAGGVGDSPGNHDRQFETDLFEHPLHGEDRRLGIEGVEDGFDHDQIGATFDQAAGGFAVVFHQFVEGDVAVAGVIDVRGQRAGTAGGAEDTGDETRAVGRLGGLGVRDFTGQAGALAVQLVDQLLHAVVGLGYAGGVEGVGFENVRAGIQVGFLDGLDDVGARQQQQVVVAFHVLWPVDEAFATVVGFFQLVALDHGAHAAVENQYALLESLLEGLKASGAVDHGNYLKYGDAKGADDSNPAWFLSLVRFLMNIIHVRGWDVGQASRHYLDTMRDHDQGCRSCFVSSGLVAPSRCMASLCMPNRCPIGATSSPSSMPSASPAMPATTRPAS